MSGKELEMNCVSCSREIPENAAFCGYCGTAIINQNISDINTQEIETVETVETVSPTTNFTIVNETTSDSSENTIIEEPSEETITETIDEKNDGISTDDRSSITSVFVDAKEPEVTVIKTDHLEAPPLRSDDTAHYAHNESVRSTISPQIFSNNDNIVKTSTFFWMILILAIPFVNLIMLLIWSFSEKINKNKRNFSRAALIWAGIWIVFSIIILIITIINIIAFGEYFLAPFLAFGY